MSAAIKGKAMEKKKIIESKIEIAADELRKHKKVKHCDAINFSVSLAQL